jgi:hypothetical protein
MPSEMTKEVAWGKNNPGSPWVGQTQSYTGEPLIFQAAKSLFERLVEAAPVGTNVQLNQCFRMHPDILRSPNAQFYNNELTCNPCTAAKRRAVPGFPWPRDQWQKELQACFLDLDEVDDYWTSGKRDFPLRSIA